MIAMPIIITDKNVMQFLKFYCFTLWTVDNQFVIKSCFLDPVKIIKD